MSRTYQFSLRMVFFVLVPYGAMVAWLWTLDCDRPANGPIPGTLLLTAALVVALTMRKGAVVGAAIMAAITSISGAGAWLTSAAVFNFWLAPGLLFSFLCLCGDSYRDDHDVLRHSIPASIAINALLGSIIGGPIGIVIRKVRRMR